MLTKAAILCIPLLPTLAVADEPIRFNRDVRPILSNACFACHGPDAGARKADLRLDTEDALFATRKQGPVIVKGRPDDSPLYRRIASRDEAFMMPPPESHKELKPREIELLRRWIEQGALWEPHWSYIHPQRPVPPDVHDSGWIRQPIDRFILAKLEAAGLRPSPEAGRATIIRRLSFDLTGLPPSPEEVDAYLHDSSPDAYARLVDRLLASPEFGVKWARQWLDLARYADSHGFQRDDLRDVWAYRDWVVAALNANMPFDQFTIEQVAGDLLPEPTQDQLIATGFHRCTPTNVEAGTEPEESRIHQVIDRVNTTGAVWLGSTFECAQCHDHKYDPITQRDYYGMLAYFNNTEREADRSNPKVPGSIRFLGPSLTLSDRSRDPERARLRDALAQLDKRIAQRKATVAAAAEPKHVLSDATRAEVLSIAAFSAESGAEGETQPDGSVLLLGDVPDKDTYTVELVVAGKQLSGLKLEALAHPALPGTGPGRGDAERANFVLHEFEAELETGAAAAAVRKLKFDAAYASFSQAKYDVAGAIDGDPKTAWAIGPAFHRSHEAVFRLAEPCDAPSQSVLRLRMVQNFGSGRVIGCFRISAITGPFDAPAANRPAAAADPGQPKTPTDPELAKLERDRTDLQKQLAALDPGNTLVMKELAEPRTTTMFERGDYKQPGQPVAAATPAVLGRAPIGPPNRLTLARWLVSGDNPLAARVTVNRWWAEVFGHGLVLTPEDFGVQGEPPTHPELLDWLAVEFVDSGWSMKHVLRRIVMSATYRQSSRVTPELLARDARNLLYSRGPRMRLDAEAIRDNALAVAGLVSLAKGGPSIRPPQPDGLWRKVGGQQYNYEVSPGEQQYRRGLYVVLKRGSPYPSLVTFDGSARLACVVQRPRTNTPLQALTLLNDRVFVDAAFAFTRRIVTECPEHNAADRIDYAFRTALARRPTGPEAAVLVELFERQYASAAADPAATKQLVGSHPVPDGVTPSEFAAWYSVAAALLNLDETITKN